jgi:hypothetical protein
MSDPNKVLYEHLKNYPTSGEGYHEIASRVVPAAWAHKPEIAEASPEKRQHNSLKVKSKERVG